MKLSIIVSVLNQYKISVEALVSFIRNLKRKEVELLVIDNDSDEKGKSFQDSLDDFELDWQTMRKLQKFKLVRNKENIGNYPVFKQGLKNSEGEILCFLHSDLFIYEKDWDERIIKEFKKNPKLGLVGFVGSNEIDSSGGRGLGTMSNFQGKQIKDWKGSPAEHHGRKITDSQLAVLIDGCSMIFRKKCLEDIGFRTDFPIHHFYDGLMCCQVLEKGWQIGVLGIECDHIGGQTVNQEPKYHQLAEKWMKEKWSSIENWIEQNKDWFDNPQNPNYQKRPVQADHWLYLEAERQFLKEFRDKKHLIPIKV